MNIYLAKKQKLVPVNRNKQIYYIITLCVSEPQCAKSRKSMFYVISVQLHVHFL